LACAASFDQTHHSVAFLGVTDIEGGFPHSEILGSKLVRSSPRHIAAYHVLHRLLAPRHPPDTLIALDCSHYRCPPPKFHSAKRRLGRLPVQVRQDTISKDQLLLRTYPGTVRSSMFTAGEHNLSGHLHQRHKPSRRLSGYVSSSRCL
jgi:hypothetical protein